MIFRDTRYSDRRRHEQRSSVDRARSFGEDRGSVESGQRRESGDTRGNNSIGNGSKSKIGYQHHTQAGIFLLILFTLLYFVELLL